MTAIKNGAVYWGQAKVGTNPDAIAMQTLMGNWLAFVRAGFNEKGNLAARMVEKSGMTIGFVNTARGFAAKERVYAGLLSASKKARGLALSPQEQAYVDEVEHNLDIAKGEDARIMGAKSPPAAAPAAAPGAPPAANDWQGILDQYSAPTR